MCWSIMPAYWSTEKSESWTWSSLCSKIGSGSMKGGIGGESLPVYADKAFRLAGIDKTKHRQQSGEEIFIDAAHLAPLFRSI